MVFLTKFCSLFCFWIVRFLFVLTFCTLEEILTCFGLLSTGVSSCENTDSSNTTVLNDISSSSSPLSFSSITISSSSLLSSFSSISSFISSISSISSFTFSFSSNSIDPLNSCSNASDSDDNVGIVFSSKPTANLWILLLLSQMINYSVYSSIWTELMNVFLSVNGFYLSSDVKIQNLSILST